jgi:hypothetical protein
MLSAYYKFKVVNDCGVNTTATVSWLPFRVGVNEGYGASVAAISGVVLAAGASTTSAAQTNPDGSGVLRHGGHVVVTVNPSAAPTGNKSLYLYLLKSNDGTTYGDQAEHMIGTMPVSAAGAVSFSFEVPF